MYNGQLELGLGSVVNAARATRRQRRLRQAQWWFDRMRRIVDEAVDYTPTPAIGFENGGRTAPAGN